MKPTPCSRCGRDMAPARVHCDKKTTCSDCEQTEESA